MSAVDVFQVLMTGRPLSYLLHRFFLFPFAQADALFLEESVSLANYFEQYEKGHSGQKRDQEPDFIRITIKGLAALADEHGVGSVQYKNAQQILKEFLQMVKRKRVYFSTGGGGGNNYQDPWQGQ